MPTCCTRYKCNCAIIALVVSLIAGIITAFLQITAAIALTPVFLWILFGISVAVLLTLVLSASLQSTTGICSNQCAVLNTVLIGILGTILVSLILIAVGITATSIVSAILIGLLLFFFTMELTTLACYIRCAQGCTE